MEVIYLDCGARRPQLKRNPLGCQRPPENGDPLQTAHNQGTVRRTRCSAHWEAHHSLLARPRLRDISRTRAAPSISKQPAASRGSHHHDRMELADREGTLDPFWQLELGTENHVERPRSERAQISRRGS